ncbi:MAG TPA: hypothetical protein VGJ28_17830 [Micromonosporaceae bacterium]|jgi:thiamine transporter ThiT
MSTTDYIVNAALILLVLRQVRESKFSWFTLVLPVVLVTGFGIYYLRSVPTGGNDLVLEIGLATAGALLGVACGLATRMRRDNVGAVLTRAGILAAVLWVAGVGARIAFSQFAEHGGGASIYRFSAAHSITSMQAWVAALILMSFAEVMARLVTMWLRARRLPQPVVATRRELVTV